MKATQDKKKKLAEDILRLSRNTLLVKLRFLDLPLNKLIPVEATPLLPIRNFAVDGEHLFYHSDVVLCHFQAEKNSLNREYLHMLFHCIFHHAFVHTAIDTKLWDVACDIAVENSIMELNLSCLKTARETEQEKYLEKLSAEVPSLTAEKIYHFFKKKGIPDAELLELRQAFHVDDHGIWYLNHKEDQNEKQDDLQGHNQNWGLNSNLLYKSGLSDFLGEEWNQIAQRMKTDLETFSKQQGNQPGVLVQNLKSVTREKYDYESFLRQFSVLGETMKINDEEFDYAYYSYGMKLYKKMPLIEPLEYKEVKRIKEFVIAIDTSGSVAGELVQRFIQKTYNILKQQENFFTKINLHIIQCDAKVQRDDKITSQEAFDEYMKRIKLYGLGGTDFRPVFSYVNELLEAHEFINLKGLIYFTDGYGTFPARQPEYKTAFCFIDDDYSDRSVPAWAIRLVLPREDLEVV